MMMMLTREPFCFRSFIAHVRYVRVKEQKLLQNELEQGKDWGWRLLRQAIASRTVFDAEITARVAQAVA